MTWKEKLHPTVSRMEHEVLIDLHKRGVHPLTNEEFCLLTTTPDYYFPNKRLAIYLDGEHVHFKRQERDKELRTLLQKRYGIRVLSIQYKRYSKKEKNRIVKQILEALE